MLATWLLLHPERISSVVLDGAKQRRLIVGDALSLSPDDQPLVDQLDKLTAGIAKAREDGVKGLPTRDSQVREIRGAESLYMHYRWASALAHAGAHTVDLYTASDEESAESVNWRPHARTTTASSFLATANVCLLRALIAWDQCTLEHPFRSEIEHVATRMGLALGEDED